MSKKFDRSPLPPLKTILKGFRGLSPSENKRSRVVELLRGVVAEVRKPGNLPFYSMREIAAAFSVPLRTVAIAYQTLETEGILVRLRGSHTQLVGLARGSHTKIAAAVGLPLWIYGFRHFLYQRHFARMLGDVLWKQSIITDSVFYWEDEDKESDFVDRLLRHQFDFALWLQPKVHNKENILFLKDRGIRSIAICDAELHITPAQIQLDWSGAYRGLIHQWKSKHDVQQIVIVEGRNSPPSRLKYFESIAAEAGLECQRQQSQPELAGRLAKPGFLSPHTAIALLDETSSTDFALRDPQAFLRLVDHHRILFGRELPSIPYIRPGRVKVDRLIFPTVPVVEACADILTKWRAGDYNQPDVVIPGHMEIGHTHTMWM